MAVSITQTYHQLKYLIGGFILYAALSCNPGADLTHHITVDSLTVRFDMEQVYDDYSWVNGADFMSINDTPHLCVYDAATNNIILANIYKDTPMLKFPIAGEMDAFWTKGNIIEYIDKNDLSKVHTISFL